MLFYAVCVEDDHLVNIQTFAFLYGLASYEISGNPSYVYAGDRTLLNTWLDALE